MRAIVGPSADEHDMAMQSRTVLLGRADFTRPNRHEPDRLHFLRHSCGNIGPTDLFSYDDSDAAVTTVRTRDDVREQLILVTHVPRFCKKQSVRRAAARPRTRRERWKNSDRMAAQCCVFSQPASPTAGRSS